MKENEFQSTSLEKNSEEVDMSLVWQPEQPTETTAVNPSEAALPEKQRGSSTFFTIMNISNNIVGSGIIVIPLALRESGVFSGILLLCICCISSGWTLLTIPMCAEISGGNTYEDMVRKVLGKKTSYVLMLCCFTIPIAVNMAYGIAIVDNLSLFFKLAVPSALWLQYRPVTAAVPFFLVILPLSLFNRIHLLDKFSSASIALVFSYIICMIIRGVTLPSTTLIMPNVWQLTRFGAIRALSIFAFGAACHPNAVSFYYSMKNVTIRRYRVAKNASISLAILLYVLVGWSGYTSFGGYPQGNIFNNYCTGDILIAIMRVVFAVTLCLTAPLLFFSVREMLIHNFVRGNTNKRIAKYVITLVLVLICYTVAALVRSLSVVVELGSALTAVPCVYIIPAICALKVYGPPYYPRDVKTVVGWMVLLLGLLILIVAPVFSIMDAVKGDASTSTPQYYCELKLLPHL